MTLCDALSYASKLPCDDIVDIATLTGACVVALGEEVAGLYADDDLLAMTLEICGRLSNEPLWRMPLHKRYNELLKSEIADTKNAGARWGGR